jgi:hypothetical protein
VQAANYLSSHSLLRGLVYLVAALRESGPHGLLGKKVLDMSASPIILRLGPYLICGLLSGLRAPRSPLPITASAISSPAPIPREHRAF